MLGLAGAPGHEAVATVRPPGPIALVRVPVQRDAVRRQVRPAIVPVQPRRGLAEDRALDGAVGRAERGEPVLLLHLLRDLEASEALDLPLRRPRPHGVRPPHHVVPAEPLDQHAHHGRAQARLGHRALGEDLPEVAVHVGDAVLGGNLREVGDPVHAPRLLELRPARGPLTADEPEGGMVDDEVELRPVAWRPCPRHARRRRRRGAGIAESSTCG